MAEAINEGKMLRAQDAEGEEEVAQEVSEEERQEVIADAVAEGEKLGFTEEEDTQENA
jgi:hypothetical protein